MRRESIDSLRQSLAIDKHRLDDELINQPIRQSEVSELYAFAVSRRDQLKDDEKREGAKLFLDMRAKLQDLGEKPTEAQVRALVDTTDEMQQLRRNLNDADLELSRLAGLKEAFIQRAFMLRELCGIYTSDYFADSAVKTGGVTEELRTQATRKRLTAARNAK